MVRLRTSGLLPWGRLLEFDSRWRPAAPTHKSML